MSTHGDHDGPDEGPGGAGWRSSRRRYLAGALVGLASAAVALAVSEFVSIATGADTSPVYAVGSTAVDQAPVGVKEFAIRTFGTSDKEALIGGIVVVLALLALAVGVLAVRWLTPGVVVFAALGGVGAYAAASRPAADAVAVAPSLVGAACGIAALYVLRSRLAPASAGSAAEPASGAVGRRHVLLIAAGTTVGGVAAGFGGALLAAGQNSVAAVRAGLRIPAPAHRAAAVPAGAHPKVPGLSPFFTPNGSFYRVDTALVLPQIRPDDWQLRVHGLVDRPLQLSFADLLRRPLDEHDMTLSCVSDPIGGPYVGNARWIGASLATLLREAGVKTGADQVVARSQDGMTISTPTESVLDGRAALLAVAMNGQPLPVAHGFPCRMLVPGFFGYASACKWVVDLELTRYADYDAYWVRQGYDRIGRMRTSSRIDVPKPFAHLAAGPVTVAGIAWATHRGIAAVEVRVDGGDWHHAKLAPQDSPDTWRQWTFDWDARPGSHTVQVRATDGTGRTQPGTRTSPYPSGATGWHNVAVTVT